MRTGSPSTRVVVSTGGPVFARSKARASNGLDGTPFGGDAPAGKDAGRSGITLGPMARKGSFGGRSNGIGPGPRPMPGPSGPGPPRRRPSNSRAMLRWRAAIPSPRDRNSASICANISLPPRRSTPTPSPTTTMASTDIVRAVNFARTVRIIRPHPEGRSRIHVRYGSASAQTAGRSSSVGWR